MAFSILVLTPVLFSQFFVHSHLSVAQTHLMEFNPSVFGSHWRSSWCYCVRHIKPGHLAFERTVIYLLT